MTDIELSNLLVLSNIYKHLCIAGADFFSLVEKNMTLPVSEMDIFKSGLLATLESGSRVWVFQQDYINTLPGHIIKTGFANVSNSNKNAFYEIIWSPLISLNNIDKMLNLKIFW